jgi:hypothetical protein
MVAAVDRMPSKSLANGYIPRCSIDGQFDTIQCDRAFCWCANVDTGAELHGTKIFNNNNAQKPDCQSKF